MTDVSDTIELTGRSLSHIDDVLVDVQTRARSAVDAPLRLRFDNHWSSATSAVAILSNALLGTLGDAPLEIELADVDAERGLMSVGVASALNARAGRTVFSDSARGLDDERLAATWTPGAIADSAAMFAEAAADTETAPLFGPHHAVFFNPHLTAPDSGSGSVTFLVRRWLTRRLLKLHGGPRLTPQRRDFVGYVGFAVDQLVGNVREHAVTAGTPAPVCLVRTTIDDDDGRFEFSVLDTGPGMVKTLVPKLPEPLRDRPSRELLSDLLSGGLPGWGRGRGVGLARVCSDVTQWSDGQLLIATDTLRISAGNQPIAATEARFVMQGTVVSVALPL